MNKMQKSSVNEIRERFQNDVERFSNLETGQVSVIDAAIALELGTEAAKRLVPQAKNLLDIGCGAGNWTLKMLRHIPDMNCTLLDISDAMLAKAFERVSGATSEKVNVIHSDIRSADLGEKKFDIIIAGASLHHLREDGEWEAVFEKLGKALVPGGCFVISDLVLQNSPVLTELTYQGWARYLEEAGGASFRDKILELSKKEDTPRPVNYLAMLLQKNGFTNIESLHKNMCFATLCAVKG
ncbi:MAG: class I SAM-dependent methyltransferase [Spirochaetaceae bacterium]|jgi:tRNA (cmo5U34)-methyltransferase|nr:class I SAM-dependent methyltransferase [Spirochaetaceae bacterium]